MSFETASDDVISEKQFQRTLMLVDDDPHVLSALERLFRREDYNILKAGSGKEALQLLEKYDVGVIISDQCMPQMMGDELLNKVKEYSPDTMRIMLSGADDFNMVTKAINNGAIYRFLTKPFDNDILLDNVGDAFHKYELNYENKKLNDQIKISNNKLIEKNRKLDEALEKANIAVKAKSDFLANTSHELRTPLNGVLGMAELLFETNLDKKQKKYIKAIIKSGNSLLSNINNILDLSKFEAGHYELEFIEFNLRSVVEDIIETLSVLAHKKNIEIGCKIDSNYSEILVGDPEALRKILTNLAGNAIKFTSEGHVTIKILCSKNTESHLSTRIEVTDTGIGIKPESIDKIFDSFTQADSNTTRLYGGTGLGLNICKQLVESMNGKIGVESKQGEGSTFRVTLDLEKPSNITPIELQKKSTGEINDTADSGDNFSSEDGNIGRNNFRGDVLVVDDNEINQEVARGMLEKAGCKVDIACNGKEALYAYKSAHYDLILMDCQMPEMDGYETTKTIRKIEHERVLTYPDRSNSECLLSHIPIIAMTANITGDDKEKCLLAGMDDYLRKPASIKSLNNILSLWLMKETAVNPCINNQSYKKNEYNDKREIKRSIIDLQKFDEIKQLLNGKFNSLIEMFITDTTKRLSILRDAIDTGDKETAWKTAHLMCGSAGNIAITGFVDLCRKLENYIKDGKEGDEYNQLMAIDNEFSAVRAALMSMIGENTAEHNLPETGNVAIARR